VPKEPTQNIVAKKRVSQAGVDFDSLFGSFLQPPAFRLLPCPRNPSPLSEKLLNSVPSIPVYLSGHQPSRLLDLKHDTQPVVDLDISEGALLQMIKAALAEHQC
jgi:hypothetical protein